MKISEMSGFLPLLKQKGSSSNQEIQSLKKRLNLKKVGHCGTLDPIADGVLPVMLNRATRTMQFFLEYPKTYLATIQFGIRTDTLDITGKVISESVPKIDSATLVKTIGIYKGEIIQKTPEYSARKFMGKNLYDYARKGIKVPQKERKVRIYDIKLQKIELPYAELEITCGSGTYIRQLISDICSELKVDGTMFSLTRSSYGRFNLNNSKRLQDIDTKDIISIADVFENYGRFHIKSKIFNIACNGSPIGTDDCIDISESSTIRYIGFEEEKILGIYRKEGESFFAEVILIE